MKLSLHAIPFNLKHIKKKCLHFERKLNRYRHGLRVIICTILIISLLLILLNKQYLIENLNRFINGEESERIDWHDWPFMFEEEQRTGLGEHGEAAHWWPYPSSSKQINDTHGYNGYLSDKIALNRSLKDLRPKQYVVIIHDQSESFYCHKSVSDASVKSIPPICRAPV